MTYMLEAPRISEMMEAAKARGETEHKETSKALFWCQLRMNLDLMMRDIENLGGEKEGANPLRHFMINKLREMATDKAIHKLLSLYHGDGLDAFIENRIVPMSKILAADTSDFLAKMAKREKDNE